MDRVFDAFGVGLALHAHVDHRAALRRHHVGADAAVDNADVDRSAVIRIVELEQFLDHVRQLEDRAGAGARIEPGVRGLALHRNRRTGRRPCARF